jgi:hypothetical protein
MKHEYGLAPGMKIYGVQLALWGMLVVLVLCFILFIAPHLSEGYARAQALRTQEMAAEEKQYCAKLRMDVGTEMHDQCILVLQEFRTKVENRIADEIDL